MKLSLRAVKLLLLNSFRDPFKVLPFQVENTVKLREHFKNAIKSQSCTLMHNLK